MVLVLDQYLLDSISILICSIANNLELCSAFVGGRFMLTLVIDGSWMQVSLPRVE